MSRKNFGSVVTESVTAPVEQHRKSKPAPIVKQGKFKIELNDGNASKRTFYIREDLGAQFDMFSASARIDKGALINVIIREWLEQNQERVDFEPF